MAKNLVVHPNYTNLIFIQISKLMGLYFQAILPIAYINFSN